MVENLDPNANPGLHMLEAQVLFPSVVFFLEILDLSAGHHVYGQAWEPWHLLRVVYAYLLLL